MEHTDFIKHSLEDLQATIRAIDVKIGILIVLQVLPVPLIQKNLTLIKNPSFFDASWVLIIIASVFILAWGASLIASLMAIANIDNPNRHIINSQNYSGIYHAPKLFDPTFLDIFINRGILKANKDVLGHSNELKALSSDDLLEELVFEQMKLAYIRTLKCLRLRFAVKFMLVWGGLALLLQFLTAK